jgi:3-hydroxybutyryl-CoA dehydrogenase
MRIETVGVVGCGLMGSGIAEVVARAGCTAIVSEVSPDALEKGRARIERSLAVAVDKGKLAGPDRDRALARLRFTTRLEDLAGCDLVVEAATEDPETKMAVFRALDRACKPEAILASNTSSIPIVELAAVTRRPDRVVGLHFFNPVPVMRLVEVVPSILCGDETVAAVRDLAERLGKRPVVARDRAGFIVNVLLVPYLLDAVRLLEQGIATKEDIDDGMRLGCGHPMGPLQLLDFIGNDTTVAIAEILHDELKEARYAAPTLLRQMVVAGLHGRKTGRGFYDYGAKLV